MKKLFVLVLTTIGSFATSAAMAQKDSITFLTATLSNGYTVLNAGEPILIYKYSHRTHSSKEAKKYSFKYFFTTKSTDVLKELTKANLKKAFPSDHAFHDGLDANFNRDEELIYYDDFHKMYKLTWIMKSSKK